MKGNPMRICVLSMSVFVVSLLTADIADGQLWKRTNNSNRQSNCQVCQQPPAVSQSSSSAQQTAPEATFANESIVSQPIAEPYAQAEFPANSFYQDQSAEFQSFESQSTFGNSVATDTAGVEYADVPGHVHVEGIVNGAELGTVAFDQQSYDSPQNYDPQTTVLPQYETTSFDNQSFDNQSFNAQPMYEAYQPQSFEQQPFVAQPYPAMGNEFVPNQPAFQQVQSGMNQFVVPASYPMGNYPNNMGSTYNSQDFGGEMSKDVGYEGPGDMRTHLWSDHASDLQREGISQGILMAMPLPLVQQWHNYFHGTEGSPGRYR